MLQLLLYCCQNSRYHLLTSRSFWREAVQQDKANNSTHPLERQWRLICINLENVTDTHHSQSERRETLVKQHHTRGKKKVLQFFHFSFPFFIAVYAINMASGANWIVLAIFSCSHPLNGHQGKIMFHHSFRSSSHNTSIESLI